jgi:TyrR family helix-turn-helix protein
MMAYDWPGNVRELENLVERLVVMTPGPVIERVDLPAKIAGASQSPDWPRPLPGQSLKDMVRDFEAAVVRRAFEAHGSQRGAARALGISQASVGRKLRTENDSSTQ